MPCQQQPVLPNHDDGYGHHHPDAAGQQVLRGSDQQLGPVHVGPGVAHELDSENIGRRVCQEREEVEEQVCQVHGEDGGHRGADRNARRDKAQLQGHQQRERWS